MIGLNRAVRLIKKTLFVGVFAYIIGNWNTLARIVFESFAGLGLIASGGSLSAGELLQPRRIAEIGLEAGRPILASIAELMGFVSFFILAIQLFFTLIEFKLAALAGFILVPFGLFNKTAFMAERVLGLVISSGGRRERRRYACRLIRGRDGADAGHARYLGSPARPVSPRPRSVRSARQHPRGRSLFARDVRLLRRHSGHAGGLQCGASPL